MQAMEWRGSFGNLEPRSSAASSSSQSATPWRRPTLVVQGDGLKVERADPTHGTSVAAGEIW